MKKIFLYSLALLSTLTFWSCKDDNKATGDYEDSDRLPRPMFICDNNTNKGSDYTYNCQIIDKNTASLYWYTVQGAAAYEIKWAYKTYVSGGEQAWIETEQGKDKKSLAGSIIIDDPNEFHTTIENLQYQTEYFFAIRALNSYSKTDESWKNDPKNSKWYGYGNLRQWADYMQLNTEARYKNPKVCSVKEKGDDYVVLSLNRKIDYKKDYSTDEANDIKENFRFLDADKTIVKVDYLTFKASASTPNATENPAYLKYDITDADWEKGEIRIDGLSKNSVYDFLVWDKDVPVEADAWVDGNQAHTTGPKNDPITITHVMSPVDTITTSDGVYIADISQYNSMKIDQILINYCQNTEMSENQVFYLEGGKAYHISTNVELYKGLTLRTKPEDEKKGLRAKLYLSGLQMQGNNAATCNFMLGRQPVAGEMSTFELAIDSINFIDLDVDVPLAMNQGHQTEGIGSSSGNYFMNMYSNGLGVNVNLIEWRNCNFQGLIRGFFRVQGNNNFFIHNIKLIGCNFYNCGYYSATAGDYAYIFADMSTSKFKYKSNILENVEVAGCVFNNTPKRPLITDNGRNQTWHADVRWNINVHHNTFVNFCTVADNQIIYTRYIPGGSNLAFHDNVTLVTKDDKDTRRGSKHAGWYCDKVQGGDNSGACTFDIYNNWTTKGGKFTANAFDASKNSPKAIKKAKFTHDASELPLHVSTMSPTDLMVSPNPKYFIGIQNNHLDYHTDDGIEGVYYKKTADVQSSDIYTSKAGAPRLRGLEYDDFK